VLMMIRAAALNARWSFSTMIVGAQISRLHQQSILLVTKAWMSIVAELIVIKTASSTALLTYAIEAVGNDRWRVSVKCATGGPVAAHHRTLK
jgi:hypothetical protein